MFQDLHVVDFHAHFPIKGDVPASTGQAERDRAAWRLAWDFPEPEPEAHDQPVDAIADRWLAELDRYGIDRVGFATCGGNDTPWPALERRIDDRDLYPLWEAVEELGVPVLIHFGMLGAGGGISWNERDNPGALERVARPTRAGSRVGLAFGIYRISSALAVS